MHLTLYPAKLTKAQFEAGAAALCALPYAIQPRVSQAINGDWSLSFQYPLSGSTGADLLALDMLVLADGQLYRVEDRERGSGRDSERCTVRAVHLMYDLRNRAIENIETTELTPGGVNQEIALEQVLNGSAFSAGTVDTDIVLDYLNILQKDTMWAIKEQVLPQWGGELLPDNWTINIRKQMGADRGVHLRHGKNIKGVRYSESLDGVVTRLHILGYQNANIESINDGKDYIDSANIGLWSTPREDYVTFPDDDLPEDLLSKGTAHLATVDTPRITLSVDLAQVRTSAQYAHYKDLERVELGDTVTVYHSRLGINITARVQSREFDPVTGENYRVELGNDNRNLYSSIASLQQAADITRMIADRNGHVRGERLRGVIDLLTSRLFASGSYVNAVVNDETGILFENTNIESVDYGAMFIGPGIFAIANEKDGTGQWIWRTFGTAGGFYGDELVAGSVTANKLASDVGSALEISSNMTITALVGERVYRAVDEAALLAHLAAQTPAVPLSVGLIWMDTTNQLLKRCTAVSPSAWDQVQINEVRTAFLEIADNLIKLFSGGKIEMASGSTIEMLAGSLFKVLSGSGIELVAGSSIEMLSGSIFKLLSGSGTNHISLDNSREDGCFLFFGGETPETAPAAFWRDGTIKNVANSYTQTVTENADGTHGVVMDVFFPDDVSLVDKVLLSIKMAPFRAYSTGAAQSAVLTSDAGGGAEKTSRSGGGETTGSNNQLSGIGYASIQAPASSYTSGPSDDNTGSSSAANTGLGGSHSHSVAAISGNAPTSDPGGHTHTGPSHLHTIESHTHTGPSHSHTGPEHVHTGNSHSHAWSDTSGGPSTNSTSSDGSHSHTITNHRHAYTMGATYTGYEQPGSVAAGSHSHTMGSHTHYVSGTTDAAGTGNTGAAGTGATGTAGTGNTGGTALSTNNAGTGNTGSGGSHTHTFTVKAHDTLGADDHNHGMAHTHSLGAHTHTYSHVHDDEGHQHSLGNHTHSTSAHTHIVDIDAHTHTVPAHAHDIVYGIYEGTTPVTVDVYVDGVLKLNDKTVVINENIAAFFSQTNNKITRNMFHTIEIRPNTLGRISAFLYIKTTQISKVAGTL